MICFNNRELKVFDLLTTENPGDWWQRLKKRMNEIFFLVREKKVYVSGLYR